MTRTRAILEQFAVIALLWLVLLSLAAHAQTDRVTQLNAGNVRAPLGGYVLESGYAVYGKGDRGQTRVKRRDKGPAVTTADFAKWKASGKGQYAFEGVPIGPIVARLAIDGEDGVQSNAYTYRHDPRPRCKSAAIDLYAPSAAVEDVFVYDFCGLAISHDQGTGVAYQGNGKGDDIGVTALRRIRTLRAHAGVWVKNSSDGVAEDLDLIDGGDYGARFDGGAWRISRVHASGFLAPATKENPDAGVGIINGNTNYFGDGIQPDHCRVGVRNYGTGSTYGEIVAKLCIEQSVDVIRRMSVDRLTLSMPGGDKSSPHFNPKPRCVVIHREAIGSVIGGPTSDVTTGHATDAVIFDVQATLSTVANSPASWGGNQRNTVLEYGHPDELLSGSHFDIWARGYACGVRLTHLIGKGNTIIVHTWDDNPSAIELGPNTRESLAGNDVRIENVQTGTWTVLARMGEVK